MDCTFYIKSSYEMSFAFNYSFSCRVLRSKLFICSNCWSNAVILNKTAITFAGILKFCFSKPLIHSCRHYKGEHIFAPILLPPLTYLCIQSTAPKFFPAAGSHCQDFFNVRWWWAVVYHFLPSTTEVLLRIIGFSSPKLQWSFNTF